MPEGIDYVQQVEAGDQEEGSRQGASHLVRLRTKHQVEQRPPDQTRTQLTEELEVERPNPGVQLTTHEEVVDEHACSGGRCS